MLSRRDSLKLTLATLAAHALPRGPVAAAAIPATVDQPVTEVLPAWVMPIEARLFVVGFVGDTGEQDFCCRTEVVVKEDGAFEVALFRSDNKQQQQVGGYAGTGQEPAGAVLSILLGGMINVGQRPWKDDRPAD